MSTLLLRIKRPFQQTETAIEWVSIHSPTGSFIVGPGHRALMSAVSASTQVTYKAAGTEHAIEVGESD